MKSSLQVGAERRTKGAAAYSSSELRNCFGVLQTDDVRAEMKDIFPNKGGVFVQIVLVLYRKMHGLRSGPKDEFGR